MDWLEERAQWTMARSRARRNPHLMPLRHPGRFVLIDNGRRPGAVALKGTAPGGDPAVEILFIRVTRHDLPTTLDGIDVRDDRSDNQEFVVSSAGGDYRVRAQSLQTHETATIYGRVLPLPRFPLRQRFLWMALLWSARFAWGQALIHWIRG